jgi:hypothetical protein
MMLVLLFCELQVLYDDFMGYHQASNLVLIWRSEKYGKSTSEGK